MTSTDAMRAAMTLGELMTNGGWAMAPIYACSALMVAIFVKKALEFRAQRLSQLQWLGGVLEAIDEGDVSGARERARGSVHPVGRVIDAMLDTFERRPDRVEAEAARCGSLELQRLEKHVGALSFIAQVAPLLGLLGTVVGMVELFIGLQGAGAAMVDAQLLASGIWKALLTTAAGLMVAVPSLAAYTFLNARTDGFRLTLSDAISQVLTALPLPQTEPGQKRPVPTLVREAADAV
ncbi:MotA/TolQ/ExbB proton channel family protein [Bradymonadaceae bacterium TMQ3]|uniref:MotA/TolQ/ExbB proton channel family protein n=2 Tax=Lujinxingia sediminis TaxID=2480984 RepID=A0ABY0CNX7_9DELT|nr:MotA/TolQ/ExbB proton channel family protein [Bradymonadaceae bacterium TMQ3]RVU41612.1 MotA/TolQ/ExbB proton channel family protein [Lujinxingia sediminis]TXC69430.1 MotA/TolQ/ExbB proton channel family protein [Bradymonadales bacterium TMQ1]